MKQIPLQLLTYTVSQLGEEVRAFLGEAFPGVWVMGEVQRLRPSRNGAHCFPQNAFRCEAREMCVNEMNEPPDPENWDQLDQSSEARLKRLRENG